MANVPLLVEFPAAWTNMGNVTLKFEVEVIIDGNGVALRGERLRDLSDYPVHGQGAAVAYLNGLPPDPDRMVAGTVDIRYNGQGGWESIGEVIIYEDRDIDIVQREVLSYPVNDFAYPYGNYLDFVPDNGLLWHINNGGHFYIPIYVLIPIGSGNDYRYIKRMVLCHISNEGNNMEDMYWISDWIMEEGIDPNQSKVVTVLPFGHRLWNNK